MFTTIDKAIAALLGSALSLLMLLGIDLPVFFKSPEVITAVTGIISGLLAYLVPNKTPPAPPAS